MEFKDHVATERGQLVEWISAWRESHGISSTQRSLSNRSLDQLRKMKAQIAKGNTYRMGRRFGKQVVHTATVAAS
jgi:hypothetical protein